MSPCPFCAYEFDQDYLGIYGCPNCEGEQIENTNTMETQIKDIKLLDAIQYESLLDSMFKLTHADAEEIGDPALDDTASYLRLALEAYKNRQSN